MFIKRKPEILMDAMLSLVACGYFAHISFAENLSLFLKLKFGIGVKILQV
jgi:hypothetical protein